MRSVNLLQESVDRGEIEQVGEEDDEVPSEVSMPPFFLLYAESWSLLCWPWSLLSANLGLFSSQLAAPCEESMLQLLFFDYSSSSDMFASSRGVFLPCPRILLIWRMEPWEWLDLIEFLSSILVAAAFLVVYVSWRFCSRGLYGLSSSEEEGELLPLDCDPLNLFVCGRLIKPIPFLGLGLGESGKCEISELMLDSLPWRCCPDGFCTFFSNEDSLKSCLSICVLFAAERWRLPPLPTVGAAASVTVPL